jgi:hypothetical protein
MDGDFAGRRCENQPSLSGIHSAQSEYVSKKGSCLSGVVCVKDCVRAGDHGGHRRLSLAGSVEEGGADLVRQLHATAAEAHPSVVFDQQADGGKLKPLGRKFTGGGGSV